MNYTANPKRYDTMQYNRCGSSGLKLPIVSLGLWQNFGGVDVFENSREMVLKAFDLGITQFDLANNYGPPPGSAEETFGKILKDILNSLGTPCLVHQPSYNMFDRWVEDGLMDVLEKNGVGSVVFSPLFQGLLTDKYLHNIPEDSRVAKGHGFLHIDDITPERILKVKQLNEIAKARRQKMAQMALSWVLRDKRVTSVIIGASKVSQIEDAVGILANLEFTSEELKAIEDILNE